MLHNISPLSVYVLWDEKFHEGSKISNELYKQLTRNIEDPLSRGLGIPVYFITKSNYIFKVSEVSVSQKNVFIVLVDNYMVVNEAWKKDIGYLSEYCDKNKGTCLLLPVALTSSAYNLCKEIAKINFIRLYDLETYKKKEDRLIFSITHELCRYMYGVTRASEATSEHVSSAPVKLFISHAKIDGLDIAKEINQYIQNDTPLDTFFDANDITVGYDFENEIKENIGNSVLLVIHSDKYSSREWCRKEILAAKKYNRPIVILNTLKTGEDRSFPYMANVRTIRISENVNYEEVITKTLLETLRFVYQGMYIQHIAALFNLDLTHKTILSYPPELLSLAHISKEEQIDVIYPDPPLSDEEIELLAGFVGKKKFITPALIPSLLINGEALNDEKILMCQKIGISISDNEDIERHGFEYIHLQDSMNEIARYLLVTGCELVYGGDINYKHEYNFVSSLFDLARTHNKENKKTTQRITNFVAYPIYENISISERAKLADVARFNEIPPIMEINGCSVDDSRISFALNLSKMRVEMNKYIDVRIIIGGKVRDFKGIYPGILEEAMLAYRSETPVFIVGSFGGVSRLLSDLLTDHISEEEFLEKFSSDQKYVDFKTKYNFFAENNGLELIDYKKIFNEIKDKGIVGLNNGLSNEENEKLFVTTNIIEAVTLIIKGLSKLSREKNDIHE